MTESLHILILEDNPADAELAQLELQEAGLVFTAKVVMTENDFIHELQTFSPDLILSDYDLPQYNGALALAEANRRFPKVPFILVTGELKEENRINKILADGAIDCVFKDHLESLLPAIYKAFNLERKF